MSWSAIGEMLATSGEAARKRYAVGTKAGLEAPRAGRRTRRGTPSGYTAGQSVIQGLGVPEDPSDEIPGDGASFDTDKAIWTPCWHAHHRSPQTAIQRRGGAAKIPIED